MRRTPLRPLPGAERDPEYDGICAAIRGESCPPGSNPFTHLIAGSARPGSMDWPRVVAVYWTLPVGERRVFRLGRRAIRLENEALRAEHMAWLADFEAEDIA
jgi:hypothetical protein